MHVRRICGTVFGITLLLLIQAPLAHATGNQADLQCIGNYDPTYPYPKINPKTKKQGLIGKPCTDTTEGHVTAGTCQALGKCLGQKTDGMMPMLPMLPMPMMMPMMPMPQMPCMGGAGSTGSATFASTSPAGCNSLTGSATNYDFGLSSLYDFSPSTFDTTGYKASDELIRLMNYNESPLSQNGGGPATSLLLNALSASSLQPRYNEGTVGGNSAAPLNTALGSNTFTSADLSASPHTFGQSVSNAVSSTFSAISDTIKNIIGLLKLF